MSTHRTPVAGAGRQSRAYPEQPAPQQFTYVVLHEEWQPPYVTPFFHAGRRGIEIISGAKFTGLRRCIGESCLTGEAEDDRARVAPWFADEIAALIRTARSLDDLLRGLSTIGARDVTCRKAPSP